jgi:hypothetical protein
MAREGRVHGWPLWSEAEDRTLRRLYPDYKKLAAALKGRTSLAVQSRVKLLGIAHRIPPWTTNEISRLRKIWATATRADLVQAFPNRSWHGIAGKARGLSLKRARKRRTSSCWALDVILAESLLLNLSSTELDAYARTGNYFRRQKWREGAEKKFVRCVQRLIKALGGADEFRVMVREAPIHLIGGTRRVRAAPCRCKAERLPQCALAA